MRPESLSGLSITARKEKEERFIEKPKIDNARRAREFLRFEDSHGGGNALQTGNKEALKEAAGNRKRK